MSRATVAYFSGKVTEHEVLATTIEEFFEGLEKAYGTMPSWLLFPDGTAINTAQIDWIRIENGGEE